MQSKFVVGAALFASFLVPVAVQARDCDDPSHKHSSQKRSNYATVHYVDGDVNGRPAYTAYRVDGGRNELRKIDERQREQNERIAQGLRSGQLTRAEAHRLLREQRNIREQERRYLADGHLSRPERGALHAQLNQASRHIRRERNDPQRY